MKTAGMAKFLGLMAILLGGCAETTGPSLLDGDSTAPTETATDSAGDPTTAAPVSAESTVRSGSYGTDDFQTTNLAASAAGGDRWDSSAWGNGRERTLRSGTVDPDDSMLEVRGHGELRINGDGTATVSGRAPRLYVQHPDETPMWQNVEVTYYARLGSLTDDAPSHSGFKIGARSWHGTRPFDDCNGKTYYGIVRFDGSATLNKELQHGTYANYRGSDVDVPQGEWFGLKFVLRDTPTGDVHLQAYIDRTGGRDGGTWELVGDHLDDGEWATTKAPVGCSYDSTHVVRGKAPAVFARFDGVERIDVRNFSVREVEPEFDEELFADVDPDSPFAAAIRWAKTTGVTRGCNPPENTRFCPGAVVTRAQMATFLTRYFDLPDADRDHFRDDDGSVHEANINAIASEGITRGCNPPDNTRYCPASEVTRGQMAAFLTRSTSLPAPSTDYFDDDDGSIFEESINRLAESNITAGCDDRAYCPDEPVTREQMVTFLYRLSQR